MPDSSYESYTTETELNTNQTTQSTSTWQKILIALVLGVACGLLFGEDGPVAHTQITNLPMHFLQLLGHVVLYIAEPIGTLFINAIKMMVIPVVFVSIVCGVISFSDPKLMGNIGLKTLTVYLLTMTIAVCIGLGLGKLIQPGYHLNLPQINVDTATQLSTNAQSLFSVKDLLTSIIPENPVQAFATANVLQTVVFAIIFGLAIIYSGEQGQPIAHFFKRLAKVIEHIPQLIMKCAPLGVFALITSVTAEFGLDVLKDLFTAVLTIYLGCSLQLILVYSIILIFVLKLSPKQFYKKMLTPLTFAFSTTSSAATLPYTREASLKMGVSKRMADFIIPLGATMNMNGLCIYLGVATIFAANIMQVDLTVVQLLLVILTGTLAAIGAAGVPGSALVVMSLVMGSIGFSSQAIALVIGLFAGVDRLIDMATTTTNISGDTIAALLVANNEGELDRSAYENEVE